MHYRNQGLSRSYLFWTVLALLVAEGVLAGLFLIPNIEFDKKVGIGLFATVGAFIITIIQLIRTQQIQRAGYIKDFLTEFRRNNELYGAYYDLVYRYRDDIYEKIKQCADEYIKRNSKPSTDEKPVFDCFDELQTNHEPGSRFFYPLFFQFSPEEKKLDGLLDYFNTIGLYLYGGLIRMEDVVTILGDYIAVLADRRIVVEYLELCNNPDEWKYDDTVGASTPYQHLRFLLESYKEYNLRQYNKKKSAELQKAIKSKEQEVEQLRRQRKKYET